MANYSLLRIENIMSGVGDPLQPGCTEAENAARSGSATPRLTLSAWASYVFRIFETEADSYISSPK